MFDILRKSLLWTFAMAVFAAAVADLHAQSKGDNDTQDADRRAILEGDDWRRTQRQFNEWLSVQTIYSDDEIAAIRAGFQEQIAKMSPRELKDFTDDMQSRLKVLLSPEAAEARVWLQRFVDPERSLNRARPDVLNMNASQIRQEIAWLQQARENRERAAANDQRLRAHQQQAGRDAQARRQQATQARNSGRSSWPANNTRLPPPPNTPRRDLQPVPLPPRTVTPWGHPLYWDL